MPRDSSWKTAVVRQDFEQRVGRRVVHRQRARPASGALPGGALAVDEGRGAVDDGERAQAEEVELHQPGRFDVVLVELRDDAAAGGVAVQRREVGEHRRGDDDAAGVHAGVARESLERARQVDEVAHLILGLVEPLELRLLLERRHRG